MRKREDAEFAKALSLIVGLAVVLLSVAVWLFPQVRNVAVGIGPGSTIFPRLCHPLFHANVAHAVLNVYVLWQLAFFFPVRVRHLLLAYLVACVCPWQIAVWPAGGECVLGLSGMVYGLMGWVMPGVPCRLRFNVFVAAWLVVGLLTGGVAVGLHLWCYVVCAAMSVIRWR